MVPIIGLVWDIGKKDPPALPQESRLQNLAGKKDLLASSQNQAYLYGPAQKTESTTVAWDGQHLYCNIYITKDLSLEQKCFKVDEIRPDVALDYSYIHFEILISTYSINVDQIVMLHVTIVTHSLAHFIRRCVSPFRR